MASKITPQQAADLEAHQGQPVPVETDSGDVVGYMIEKTAFLRMHGLGNDPSENTEEHLRSLIQDGLNSADVSAGDVYQSLRDRIQQSKNSSA